MSGLQIRAYKVPWGDKVELLGAVQQGSKVRVAQRLALETQDEGCVVDPFASLDMHEAQVLMDSLWECGLRPSEGTGSAGAMKATERHLEDMRKIAGAKLNVAL